MNRIRLLRILYRNLEGSEERELLGLLAEEEKKLQGE